MGNKVIGFSKIQRAKKLFHTDEFGIMDEKKVTAVIDFYIHQSYAKQGYGKALLEHILDTEFHPNGQVGFFKTTKTFVSFMNRAFNGKIVLFKLDNDYAGMHYHIKQGESNVSPPILSKNSSQTNLNVLNSSNKMSSRGNVFNNVGRDLITQSTTDLSKFKDNDLYEPQQQNSFRNSKKLEFDEYLVEYERMKANERNKSPAEHRSKYYNDVFSSNVNMGNKKDVAPRVQKIMMEINNKSNNEPLTARPMHYSTPMTKFQQNQIKDTYIPNIHKDFKPQVDGKELVKPKGRFKHWKPVMRDLEGSYQLEEPTFSPKRQVSPSPFNP
jgi:hypothetical protein